MIRVLLADDEALVRSGLRLVLEADPEIEILAEAGDGAEAVTLARELSPEVVLLDLQMPRLDGLGAIPRLLANDPGIRVLVLTTFGDERNIYLALRAGAAGFLLKTCRAEELREAVRGVAAGRPAVSVEVVGALVQRYVRSPPTSAALEALAELTERELDVMRHAARGLSNTEIGAAMFLGESTVKSHLHHLMRKLGCETACRR